LHRLSNQLYSLHCSFPACPKLEVRELLCQQQQHGVENGIVNPCSNILGMSEVGYMAIHEQDACLNLLCVRETSIPREPRKKTTRTLWGCDELLGMVELCQDGCEVRTACSTKGKRSAHLFLRVGMVELAVDQLQLETDKMLVVRCLHYNTKETVDGCLEHVVFGVQITLLLQRVSNSNTEISISSLNCLLKQANDPPSHVSAVVPTKASRFENL